MPHKCTICIEGEEFLFLCCCCFLKRFKFGGRILSIEKIENTDIGKMIVTRQDTIHRNFFIVSGYGKKEKEKREI